MSPALRTRVGRVSVSRLLDFLAIAFLVLSNNIDDNYAMSSWAEPQYESHPNQPYLHHLDVPDGSMREAEHPPSLLTSYSYTPRPSPNSSRQTYSSGLYGPRPQPSHPEPIQGLPTPAMVPPAMSDLEEEPDD